MSLEMLTIEYEEGQRDSYSGAIEALFNPTQLEYSRSASWAPVHTISPSKSQSRLGFTLDYQSTSPETLSVELFFDTYATGTPRSVLPVTARLAELASVDSRLIRPPVCKLRWGREQLFLGVLQQASRTLQLFLEDGTPVRATVRCVFMEYSRGDPSAEPPSSEKRVRQVPGSSADARMEAVSALVSMATQYVVRPGDTLMGIASAVYGDGSLWRRIADANRIDDPRRLTTGRTLSIPGVR